MPVSAYQPLYVDNRPTTAQFIDSSPITEGMANLASSLVNAGPAAAQIRDRRAQQDMADMWRQQQFDRQSQQDQLGQMWKEREFERSGPLIEAQIANLLSRAEQEPEAEKPAFTAPQAMDEASEMALMELGWNKEDLTSEMSDMVDKNGNPTRKILSPEEKKKRIEMFKRAKQAQLQNLGRFPTGQQIPPEVMQELVRAAEDPSQFAGFDITQLDALREMFPDPTSPVDLEQPGAVTGPTTPGVTVQARPAAVAAMPNKGSRSLSAAVKATGKNAATVRAELEALGYTVTP